MRIHRNLAAAVVEALRQIFEEGKYADRVLEKVLRSDPRWGARDRAFIAENTYDIVRHYRLLCHIAEVGQGQNGSANYWRVLAVQLAQHTDRLPDWPEWGTVDMAAWQHRAKEAWSQPVLRESVPDWMEALGQQELGADAWHQEIAASNKPAPLVIRANTLKASPRQLASHLIKDHQLATRTVSWAPDALVFEERRNLFSLKAFQAGWFEMQDAGSQLIAPFLDLQPGMDVIDACAGAGGKALHIAALLQNQGRILAMDTEEWKLDELRRRSRRAGATIIETRGISSPKIIQKLHQTADRLLLDVPCSGLGVLRRNPDAKWKLTPEFITSIRQTQAQILAEYAPMVRPGGKMVYATCSLLPSENRQQVQQFLDRQDGRWTLLAEHQVTPASYGFDGFYMACLQLS